VRPSDARSAERGVPLASAFIRCCCCCCCCRPGCVSSVRATRGARSAERGARRRRPSDARSAERWLVCRVQYECQRASSCALVATGARVCQSAGGAFDDSAGVYTGVPGERRLPLLACLWLETDGTPALGLGPLILGRLRGIFVQDQVYRIHTPGSCRSCDFAELSAGCAHCRRGVRESKCPLQSWAH
jgi:hypothetical protein